MTWRIDVSIGTISAMLFSDALSSITILAEDKVLAQPAPESGRETFEIVCDM
jgi:hypothetical protein